MKRALVIKEHKNEFPLPLIVRKGDILQIKEKKTDQEGWFWCINNEGLAAWMPKNYLKRTQTLGFYQVLLDYDSTELDVKVGDKITIIKEESNWAWIVTEGNKEGWIPIDCISLDIISNS